MQQLIFLMTEKNSKIFSALYEFLPRALFWIALEFGWTQMAVITQTENLFTAVRLNFHVCLYLTKL